MTKTTLQDIKQNKYEEKKILRHEETEATCDENRSRDIKRKAETEADEQ